MAKNSTNVGKVWTGLAVTRIALGFVFLWAYFDKLLGLGMAAAMLLAASSALAAGINLAWSTCHGDGGTSNRVFACTANTGSNILVTSFVLDADAPQVSGNELVVDILTTSNPIPRAGDAGASVKSSCAADMTMSPIIDAARSVPATLPLA